MKRLFLAGMLSLFCLSLHAGNTGDENQITPASVEILKQEEQNTKETELKEKHQPTNVLKENNGKPNIG